jgi:hypothetical protein
MPEKRTLQRVRRDARQGKAATTQAGEFVREEMEHAKSGKHRVKGRKQAIAIGLSKARRSGVKIGPNPNRRRPKRSRAVSSGRRSTGSRASARTAGKSPRRRTSRRGGKRRS